MLVLPFGVWGNWGCSKKSMKNKLVNKSWNRAFHLPVWHRFRYALGHHMFRHKESPFNEKEALSIQSSATRIAHEIANLTHPIDPLFESPIHKKEVMAEMQRLTLDKSPGPDGVTNRMLRSGGEKFNTILHEVIATPSTTIRVAKIVNATNL